MSNDQTLSGEQSASLWAGNIASLNPLQRVWAVIIPPDYESTYSGEAVTDLSSLDLTESTLSFAIPTSNLMSINRLPR